MNTPAASQDESADRIRVLIVDDQAVIRTGLRFFLLAFDDLNLVGEAASGEEALRLCAEFQPDVVLMDLLMPGLNGAETTRRICEQWPQIQVIVLTNFHKADLVQEALQAGAIGYLLKNVSAEELADAVRAANAGRPTLAPEATKALIQATVQRPIPGHDLTPREQEVLDLMAQGLANPEIARRLTIGLSTVKFHVSSILTKLGATSRVEATAIAWQHNLVNRSDEPPSGNQS